MRFFDINKNQKQEIDLSPKDQQKKPEPSGTLDLTKKQNKTKNLVTDITGNTPKKAFGYLAISTRKNFKNLHLSLLKFGVFALLVAFLINAMSVLGIFLTKEQDLRVQSEEIIINVKEALNTGKSGDILGASAILNNTLEDLETLLAETEQFTTPNNKISSDSSLFNQTKFIQVSVQSLAEAFELALKSFQHLVPLKDEIFVPEGEVDVASALRREYNTWQEIDQLLITAQDNLNRIDTSLLPSDIGEIISSLSSELNQIVPMVSEALPHFEQFLSLIGADYPRKYLFLFQNRNELRPTGGFIGSVALVEFNSARLTNVEIKDVYDFDGQITEFEDPPEYFGGITNTWGLRDSNYSYDFPTSAKTSARFYEKGGGATVDGVFAIDQSLIEDLLNITGPIDLDGFPAPLTADNFSTLLSFYVEHKTFGATDPKKPLKEFYPLFQSLLIENAPDHLPELINIIFEARGSRQIQGYSIDQNIENLLISLGIDGRDIEVDGDYLAVIRTNIAGNKSDFFTSDAYKHKTTITDDGAVIDELHIERTHAWQNIWEIIWEKLYRNEYDEGLLDLALAGEGEDFAQTVQTRNYISDNMYEILGRGANKDYTRIYVPKGSKLITAEGISVDDIDTYDDPDTGKTVFALMFETRPDTTRTIAIQYKLPESFNTDFDDYNFYFQHQAGTGDIPLNKSLKITEDEQFMSCYPAEECPDAQTYSESTLTSRDYIFGAVVGN